MLKKKKKDFLLIVKILSKGMQQLLCRLSLYGIDFFLMLFCQTWGEIDTNLCLDKAPPYGARN